MDEDYKKKLTKVLTTKHDSTDRLVNGDKTAEEVCEELGLIEVSDSETGLSVVRRRTSKEERDGGYL